MTEHNANEAFDLIYKIVLNAKRSCNEHIPEIIEIALDEIEGLAKYKGSAGNPIPEDRRKLLGLTDE